MKYQISYLPKAEKFFKKYPKNIASHVFNKIQALETNPHAPNNNLTKLKDPLSGYRLRIGDFRAIFIFDESTKRIIVAKIDHRSSVYLN